MKYKIKNLPRFLSHKALRIYIEKGLNLIPADYNFSYRPKQSYGVITVKKELECFKFEIRDKVCKVVPFVGRDRHEEIVEVEDIDIRDSVTELWKMSYDEQLKVKQAEIEKFYNAKVNMHGSDCMHRNNCQFTFGFDKKGDLEIGFRAKGLRDYNLVFGVEECNNVSLNMKNKLSEIKKVLDGRKDLIYDRETKKGFLKLLMIKETECESICLVQLAGSETFASDERDIFAPILDILQQFPFENLYYCFSQKIFEGFLPQEIHKIRGCDFLLQRVGDRLFKITFFSFFQVNVGIAAKICDVIGQRITKNDTLLDLCCGSGFFGIMLSNKFKNVIGVENNEESIKNLNENINLNKVINYVPKKSDVENEFFYEKSSVILDPPRSGVSKKTIQNIRRNENIKEIFYVACNYELANQNITDLCKDESKAYKNESFVIKSIEAFDMFPFTKKVEVLIHLVRD